jgi:protein SCO1/2
MTLRTRDLLFLVLILALAAGVAISLIHGPAAAKAPDGSSATRTGAYAGLTVSNPKQAPPLALNNYLGSSVNIASYRGKAVLVTFLYTHCPDICPLITSKLHTALSEMSSRERRQVQIIAVSVDPRGDRPSTVSRFLASHEMTGQMQYLIGSPRALGAVWSAWGVGATREASDPALVAHTALVYGITGKGTIVTIYPSTFKPSDVVHDVPLLAAA